MLMVALTLTCELPHPYEDSRMKCILIRMLLRSNPCHIELILTEGEEVVQKSDEVVNREQGKHLNSRQRAQRVRKTITQG